jgi:tetratricopeptide (TPR) repeat protein
MSAEPRRLTVAMIVRDAEDQLAASLESVRRWADEILVADTGSVDRTRQLALARASRVIDVPWTDDFSAARNACMDQATGDWILWLDAGERIAPETAQAIRRFVDERANPNRVYMALVGLPPTGEHQMVEQVGRVRLMPNKPNLRFSGRLRENLRGALAASRMEIEAMSWLIQRSLKDLDSAVKSQRARRDLKLAELELADLARTGEASGALANLARGEAWLHLGNSVQAEQCFRLAIATAPRGSTEMLEAYYGLLTLGEGCPDDRDQQVKTCLEALEIFPFDGQLLCAMGGYMQSAGRLDLASRAYRAAVRHGQINLETWHVSAIGEVAVTCLSLTLELLGEDAEAKDLLIEALAADGASVRLRRRLIDLHVKHDRRQEALEQAALLPSDTPHRDTLRGVIRGACLAAQKNWVAARPYLQTAYDAGCRDLLCLRWLGMTLFASNDFPAAEPVLRQWLALAPGNADAQKYLDTAVARVRPVGSAPIGAASATGSDRRLRIDLPSGAAPLNLVPERAAALPPSA